MAKVAGDKDESSRNRNGVAGFRGFSRFQRGSGRGFARIFGWFAAARSRERRAREQARTHERVETDPISGFFQRSQAERGSERSPAITVHTLLQKNVMLETTGRWWIAARGKSHDGAPS